MNSSATKSTPIHVLALYDSTRAWSGAKSHSKNDQKNLPRVRRHTSILQDGASSSSSAASSKESSTFTAPAQSTQPSIYQ